MRADTDNYLVIFCILLPVKSSRSQSGSVSVRINISPLKYNLPYLKLDVEILSPQSEYELISTGCLQQCTDSQSTLPDLMFRYIYQTNELCYHQIYLYNPSLNCGTRSSAGTFAAVIEGHMELAVNRAHDQKSITVSVSCISNSYKLLFNGTELTSNKIYWGCVRYYRGWSYYHNCYTSYSSNWTYSTGSIREFSCRPESTSRTQTTLITQPTTQPATTATTRSSPTSSKPTTVQTSITTTQPAAQTLKTSMTPTSTSTYSRVTGHGGTRVSDENSTNSPKESTSEGVNGLYSLQTANMNSDKGDNSSVALISGILAAAVVVIIVIIIITVSLLRRRKSGEQDNRDNVVTHQNNVYESDYSSQPACDTGVDDDNYNILHHRVRVRNDDIYQEGEDYFQLEHSNGNRTATGSYHLVEPPQWTNQNADQEETTPNEYRVVRADGVEELYSEINKDDRAVGPASTGDNKVMMVENVIYEGAQVDDEEVVYSLAE